MNSIQIFNFQIYYASPPFCLPLLKSVEQILEKMKDYDLNEIEEGATPLHYAVQLGSYQLVTLLLERKAIPNFKDKSGYLPLELAIWSDETNEKDEIATALVKGMSRRR